MGPINCAPNPHAHMSDGSGSFRPITKSAHVNFGPCQFRPIAISAHKFCQPGFLKKNDILLKIFKIYKYYYIRVILRKKKKENRLTLQTSKD